MANHLTFAMLSALIESRTRTVDEPKARRHLATCGRCRSELGWLQRIRSLPAETVGSRADFGRRSAADELVQG